MRHKTVGCLARAGALAVALCATACSSGGAGGRGGSLPASAPPAIVRTYAFPSGDARTEPGGIAWDITGVTTTLTGNAGNAAGNLYDTLRVDVTFVQDISASLPGPAQPFSGGNQLGVSVALDVDASPQTGAYPTCVAANALRPFEYQSDAGPYSGRLADGNYSILNPNGQPIYQGGPNPAAEAVTSVAGHVFSQSFFLPAVNVFAGADAPKIGLRIASLNALYVSGNDYTDCVPRATSEIWTV